MYVNIPISVFYFALGYILGIVSLFAFGTYMSKKEKKERIKNNREIMQNFIDSLEDDKKDNE